jgi:hypothetical protein
MAPVVTGTRMLAPVVMGAQVMRRIVLSRTEITCLCPVTQTMSVMFIPIITNTKPIKEGDALTLPSTALVVKPS